MLKLYKKALIVLIIGIAPVFCLGQNNSSSPYSFFGVGDLANVGFGRNRAMGGVSSPLMSAFNLNPANPASYAGLLPNTFLFEFGLNMNNYTISTPSESYSKLDGNIAYVAAGFPIAKWWKSGIGIRPLSNIGYEIREEQSLELEDNSVDQSYTGEGGINSLYFDNSFQLLKSLSLGVKVAYTFGSLDRNKEVRTNATPTSTSSSILTETNRSVFDAVSVGFRLDFHKVFKEDYYLNIGATYNLKTKLKGEQNRLIISNIINAQRSFYDTLVNEIVNAGAVEFPVNYSIGASLIYKQKIEFAFDYQVDKWSESKFYNELQNFGDNQRICAGIEYIPDFSSSKYLNLIRYRVGYNQTNSYIIIDDKQLKQVGGSLGLGFPLRSGALINVSVQYNSRSIPGEDILKENFFQFHLNLSLRSSWFFKYKYD